jgi:Mn-dependent DtxR family transcriptional regulator
VSDLDFASLLHSRLFFGRDGAVTIGQLAESLNVPRRQVEQAVEQLRRDGKGIITGSFGVYLSLDPRECERAAEALRRRAITILLGARALRRTARRMGAMRQMELFG